MTCSRCATNEASVFFKQILGNKVTELHLCAPCAQAAGISEAPNSLSLDLLFGGLSPARASQLPARAACPSCGLRFAEFRSARRLGCAGCYDAFAAPLAEILRRAHGSLKHGGQPCGRALSASSSGRRRDEAERLKRRLAEAVRSEDFEGAAELRDRLRALES